MKKNLFKRGLALLLALMLVVAAIPMSASAAVGTWTNHYDDVKKSDWYYNAVKFMNYYNFISGTSDTTFSPNTTTSRAMFVTILGRIVGTDTDSYAGTSRFADVKAGHWAEPSIAWAAANGIVNGVGNNRFDPNGAVTREQSATILYNFLNSTGYDVAGAGNALSTFTDTATISNYARNAMNWIVSAGIIAGDGTGTIKPKSNAPRSQIAQILMKFANHKAALDGKAALEMPEDFVPRDNEAVEGYEDGEHIQYLPNGKVATTLNAQEILFSLQEQYPEGTKWGYEEGACQAYADMCASALAPNKKEWRTINNPRIGDIRVGDQIYLEKGAYKSGYVSINHVGVALKVYSDHVVYTDGNNNGQVSWGGLNVLYDYEIAQGSKFIKTPWKYDDIVREPESETYQIDDFFEPVNIYAATLRNGSAISPANILNILSDFRARYPEGSTFSSDSILGYNWTGPSGIAYLSQHIAFSEEFDHTISKQNSSFALIKVGDILNSRDSNDVLTHYFVLDKNGSSLSVAYADSSGKVTWDGSISKDYLATCSYSIRSRYYGSSESVS